MHGRIYDHETMVKHKRQPPPSIASDLHIGPWIAFMGRRASEIARTTDLNEGYLSQLISGEKHNPSYDTVKRIADELGIPIDALRQLPPDRDHSVPTNPWPTLFSLLLDKRRTDKK